MKYLVGDIGNTFIKLSILSRSFKIKKIYNLETKKVFNKKSKVSFLKKFDRKTFNKKVIFSSVVHKAFKIVKKNLRLLKSRKLI